MTTMKLITEYIPGAASQVIEESATGEKKVYIEGIFMESAKKNRNGRIYPTEILEREVNKYITEQVDTYAAIGELNHPKSPIPDPDNASHRIVKLEKQGNDFYGKALVLDTRQGLQVKALLKGEVRLGVSSRGLGTVKMVNGVNEIQEDYQLKTVDIVHNPSAINAFVNGIMEGVDYQVDGSIINQNDVDMIEQTIKETPAAKLQEVKLKLFMYAMKSISEAGPYGKFKIPKYSLLDDDDLIGEYQAVVSDMESGGNRVDIRLSHIQKEMGKRGITKATHGLLRKNR